MPSETNDIHDDIKPTLVPLFEAIRQFALDEGLASVAPLEDFEFAVQSAFNNVIKSIHRFKAGAIKYGDQFTDSNMNPVNEALEELRDAIHYLELHNYKQNN